jgi:hypothetical protein
MMTAPPSRETSDDPTNMNEMLQELRILLQGSQVLTAFLVVLPFSARFSAIVRAEQWVYVATFLCSLISLVLFSAPAVHHRLQRPLLDRVAFKDYASRMMVIGMVPLTMALVLMTQLVTSEVIGELPAAALAGGVALFVVGIWWVLPLLTKRPRRPDEPPGGRS